MLDAGSVIATLGGRYDGTAFQKFDSAMLGSGRKMNAFERGLHGSTQRASRALHAMGTAAGVGAAGGVAALGVALVDSVKVAGEFERGMRNVNSIAGLNEKQFQKLTARVLGLSGRVAQAPKTLAAGLYDLVSSGFDANESMVILEASSKAATAGLTDTATSTRAVAAALNAYRLPASKAGEVSDILFQTVNRGVVSFAELAQNIGDVLPFAAAMGVNLKQVGAALSTMTKEGLSGAEATTRLKNLIQAFIKPSDALSTAVKKTGAASGEALVKHRGLQGALEAVIKTTDGSKKAVGELFPNIRALGGALALTGGNAKAAHQDLKGFADVSGATEKVFKEQSKSTAMAQQHLHAYWQQAQILVGGALLPILAEQAGKLSHALSRAAKDGSLEQFGRDLGHTLQNLISFAGDVAPALLAIGQAAGDVAGAIAPLITAVAELIANADPDVLVALAAGIAAFMVAETVVPVIYALGAAISYMATAAMTAPTVGAFLGDIVAMANPVGLVAAGVGALAAAFVLLSGNENDEAAAAGAVTDAKKAEADAIQAVHDAVLGAASATFAAAHADDALRDAKQAVATAARKYGKDSKQYREALQNEREAALRSTAEHERLKKAKEGVAKADERAREQTKKTIAAAKELLQARIKDAQHDLLSQGGNPKAKVEATERIIDAMKRYNATVQDAARGTAIAAISQIQLARVLNGQKLITDQNAASVANLTRVWKDLPKETRTKLSTTSGPALAQIGDLVGALRNIPKQQVVQVLARADGAKAQIAALRAVVEGIPARRVIDILSTAPTAQLQVAALNATIAGVPRRTVAQILANGAIPERVKVLALSAAIKGVPARKVAQIIADSASTAQQKVDALNSAIAAIPASKSSTITVTTNEIRKIFSQAAPVSPTVPHRAQGKRAGAGELALVGEDPRNPREYVIDRTTGHGYVTAGPMFVHLGPDDYVIPTDNAQSGRALGLFRQLARDLGIGGYKKGKKGGKSGGHHHAPRHVPGKLDPLSIPVDELDRRANDARSKLQAARNVIQSAPGQIESTNASIRDIERRTASSAAQKQNKAEDLARAKKKLAQQKADLAKARREGAKQKTALANLTKELRTARAYQARLDKQTDLANLGAQGMQIADANDDQGAYDQAKARRGKALAELKRLLDALTAKHIKVDSAYFRKVQGEINQAVIDQQELDASEMATDSAPEPEAMTDAEKTRLSDIQAKIALAALTPDLADDKAGAQELVDLYAGVLSEVLANPAAHGGSDSITEIAGALKQAQDNMAALTGGGGTNDNADLQAQLDQANERARIADEKQRIAETALSVFGGSGDIGTGGPNAGAAAAGITVHQTINTLHPADPATLDAIGSAATAGMGLQGLRRAPRQRIGV